jgi:NADH:ubiquinone oxidoreductase subunit 5 (subunit L)/multisubunit Na+/H+ antiporter MnhA subunit
MLFEAGARSALVLIVALPLLTALALAVAGQHRPGLGRSLGPVVATVVLLVVVVLAVRVVADGPVAVVVERADGRAVAGLVADRLGVLLLLLTCGVSAVVQGFARRYLRGDRRADLFFLATALLAASTAAMVTAVTLVGLAVAWTLVGIALCLLLAMDRTSVPARAGLRRTALTFLLGDAALWAAVAVVTLGPGDVDLRGPVPPGAPAVVTVVASLVVVAALARSAQVPFHGWLPMTLAVPTPVSALLHAGVVNGGGVLLVRSGALLGAAPLVAHLAFAAGAATAIYGTVLMLVRSDVKGALAHSTMGQMGFMIMICGLGWYAAAVVHLVAHGMYKATLFLGSGSAVHRHVRHLRTAPRPALTGPRRAVVSGFAGIVPAALLTAAAALLPAHGAGQGTGVLLLFAWATAAWSAWGWMRRRPTASGALTATGVLVVVLPAYVLLVGAVTAFLGPALPDPGPAGVTPWLLVPVLAVMAGVALVRLLPGHPRLGTVHRALYVRALGAAHPQAAPGPARPVLVTASEGTRP